MKTRSAELKIIIPGLICVLLLLCPLSANAAEELRAATIADLAGEVSVMKAGGEKPIKAFKNMSLTHPLLFITIYISGHILMCNNYNCPVFRNPLNRKSKKPGDEFSTDQCPAVFENNRLLIG